MAGAIPRGGRDADLAAPTGARRPAASRTRAASSRRSPRRRATSPRSCARGWRRSALVDAVAAVLAAGRARRGRPAGARGRAGRAHALRRRPRRRRARSGARCCAPRGGCGRPTRCSTPTRTRAVTAARPVVLGAAARAPPAWTALQVARLSLYEDAATVAAAAPKLLRRRRADTAAWLADLGPAIETAARDAVARARARRAPGHRRRRCSTCAPSATTDDTRRLFASPRAACGSGSPARSGPARARWSPRCARRWRASSRSASSPTTSTPTRTRASCSRAACCPTSGSSRCRPAAARTPRSATTSAPTCSPSRSWRRREGPLDAVLVESGGDNLTATFSPALADAQVFVLDTRRRRRRPAQGRPGGRARRPAGDRQGRHRAAGRRRPRRDARRRRRAPRRPAGRWPPTCAARPTSRPSPRGCASGCAEHRAGALVAADPGPMAPHVHASPPTQRAMPTPSPPRAGRHAHAHHH